MIRYLITDPSIYGNDATTLCQTLRTNLLRKPADLVCLRDKQTKDYPTLASAFVAMARGLHVKVLLHTNWSLASSLGADGVHLPSCDIMNIPLAKASGLFVVASTHTKEEAIKAASMGADAITFSPIFDTPNKGKPVGLEKLKEIIDTISIDCYALGGIISERHITQCGDVGAHGFASIRYFCS